VCEKGEILALTGKAPGDPIDTKGFFRQIAGDYKILLAGGQTPEPPAKAFVDANIDDQTGDISVHFCLDGLCTEDNFFDYGATKVYRRSPSDGRVIYTLVVTRKGATDYYLWDVEKDKLTYRNLQFTTKIGVYCVEHVLRKSARTGLASPP
jgi:hypothetical protein